MSGEAVKTAQEPGAQAWTAPHTRSTAVLVMHYIEGWLSDSFPDASRYLREHIEEMADQMIEDGCAAPDTPARSPVVTAQARERVTAAIREADTLEEAIGIAIGAASACWDNLEGAGVFESERAAAISETLLDLVRGYVR